MALRRNDPCPCGSGRKYKHCHGADAGAVSAQASAQQLLAAATALLQRGEAAQAERLLQQVLEREPADARATHFLGMARFRLGRTAEGLEELRRAVALAPRETMFQVNLGLLLAEAEKYAEAETCFRAVIALEPDSVPGHNYLGMALERQGRLGEAMASLEKAARLRPDDDSVQNNLGMARLDGGDAEGARANFERAIFLNPRNAMARNNLGNALRALGDVEGAIRCYRNAVQTEPELWLARHNLGAMLADTGAAPEALEHLVAATRLAPGQGANWQRLARALGDLRFSLPDPAAEQLMLECLARADIDPAPLASAAASLLRCEAMFSRLLEDAASGAQRPVDWISPDNENLLSRPLLLGLLENAILPETDFERLIVAVRRAALLAWKSGALHGRERLRDVLAAIAHQCFLCEYIHDESADESGIVASLGAQVEETLAAGSADERELALFACYRPLAGIHGIDRLRAEPGTLMGRLLERQVAEPALERQIAPSLPSLAAPGEEVSLAVKAMYEENPYPRWLHAPSIAAAFPIALRLRTLFPHLAASLALPERPAILIAGCGTGLHAAITAMLHPGSRILAVDLSRASLAFAARRARKLGLQGIEFAQGDILAMGALAERFQLIEYTGVLHHMRAPLAGWRVLCSLLAPAGVMKIGLYSEAARAGVVAARRLIAERGFAPDLAGIRAARAAILELPGASPARALAASPDFHSASGCRDLLFHVQEHRFTLPAIAAMIGELKLEFLGFEFENAVVLADYRREHPADAGANSLAGWAAYEERHPDTFAGMYQFWVRSRT
ncbi:MAG: tetratricopeptide repeat protein [Betaproteobacteria bacterium]|nr:tetratricopeptide repeat protein [Betaproteobacteria bacterium]